jgi:hypothetical protein
MGLVAEENQLNVGTAPSAVQVVNQEFMFSARLIVPRSA